MAYTAESLYTGNVGATATTLATGATAPSRTLITEVLVHNTDDETRVVDLHRVPAAGSASASNRFYRQELLPDDSGAYHGTLVLNPGETLQAVADVAAVVTATVSGAIQ
jgi:hypothetical protein